MKDKEQSADNRRSIEFTTENLSDVESIFIAALAAARADGTVDSDEKDVMNNIASLFGHEKTLSHAYSYFESFQDNEAAMDGVLRCLSDSSNSAKLAAFLFMQKILDLNGMDEKENRFFTLVLSKMTKG